MDVTKLIRYIETLPVGDGDLLGDPYRLLKYQKQFLRGAFKPGIIRAGFTLGSGRRENRALRSALGFAVLYSPILPYINQALSVAWLRPLSPRH